MYPDRTDTLDHFAIFNTNSDNAEPEIVARYEQAIPQFGSVHHFACMDPGAGALLLFRFDQCVFTCFTCKPDPSFLLCSNDRKMVMTAYDIETGLLYSGLPTPTALIEYPEAPRGGRPSIVDWYYHQGTFVFVLCWSTNDDDPVQFILYTEVIFVWDWRLGRTHSVCILFILPGMF